MVGVSSGQEHIRDGGTVHGGRESHGETRH